MAEVPKQCICAACKQCLGTANLKGTMSEGPSMARLLAPQGPEGVESGSENAKLRSENELLKAQVAKYRRLQHSSQLGEATKTTADAGRGPQLKNLLAACRKLHAFTGGENTDKAGTIAKLKDQLDVLKRKSKGNGKGGEGKSREGED